MPVSPIMIRIEPRETSLAQIMNEVRAWLDSNKIEPVDFKTIISHRGVGCELRFQKHEQADLFKREFV
jgi:hypothetical protein